MNNIETMRLALEALKCLLAGNSTAHQAANAITALRQAIEQAQKQEPVAWALWWEDDPDYFVDDYISTYKEVVEDEFLPTVVGNPKVIPLYTSPPPRQWVGLTDEELPPLAGDNGKYMELQQVRRFYKYIEAKLKEKNT
jgi:hypothetical protein